MSGPFRIAESKTVAGRADYFTGKVCLADLMPPQSAGAVAYKWVSFEPGARTNWHVHAFAQDLYVVAGICFVQIEGQKVIQVQAGEMYHFPAGVLHWHGAGPTLPCIHLAINGDGATDWKHPVSSEEYAAG